MTSNILDKDALAWLKNIVDVADRESHDHLFVLLKRGGGTKDMTVDVLNTARSLISQVYAFTGTKQSAWSSRATNTLFLTFLHSLLHNQQQPTTPTTGAAIDTILHCPDLLESMIIISLEVVNFCQLTNLDTAFPYITSSILNRLDTGVEIWQAAGLLLDLSLIPLHHHHINHNQAAAAAAAFSPFSTNNNNNNKIAAQSTLIREMPRSTIGYLKMIQSRIEEVLVWATPNSSIYQRMLMSPSSSSSSQQQRFFSSVTTHASNDRNIQLLSCFLQALADTGEKRSEASSLSLYNTFPILCSTIQDLDKKIKAAVLHILVNHLDMLFVAQHLMVLVACASFYVLKNHNNNNKNVYPFPSPSSSSSSAMPTFHQVILCLTSSLPGLSPSDFKDITVYPHQYQNNNNNNNKKKKRTTPEKMNCREFYNTLFVQMAEQWDPKEVFGLHLMKTMDCPLIHHNNGGKPKGRKPLGRVDGNT